MQVNIAYPIQTTFMDYMDNKSQAVLIFFMGCEHNCAGCHNSQFQNRNIESEYVKIFDVLELQDIIIDIAKRNYTDKIVFSGGDPLYRDNLEEVKYLLYTLKQKGLKVTLYTGYDFKYVTMNNVRGYEYIKCGPYIESLKQSAIKTDKMFVLSSKNQEVYNSKGELISNLGIVHF